MNPIIYIVGAISSDPDWKAKFQAVKDHYESLGFNVLSPLDYPENLTYRRYMQLSMEYVFKADLILALPDWDRSPGATAEIYTAMSIDTPIIYERVVCPAEVLA